MAKRKSAKKAMSGPKKAKKKLAPAAASYLLVTPSAQLSDADKQILDGIVQMLQGAGYNLQNVSYVPATSLGAPTIESVTAPQEAVLTSCP